MHNPYNVGNWVKRPHFYGRSLLIEDLLHEERQCTYLMGARRVGKTSVLRDIEARGSFIGLFINLQGGVGNDGRLSSAKIMRLLKRELTSKVRNNPSLSPLLTRVEGTTILCDTLQELAWAAQDIGVSVMLLWDEAENLLELKREELEPLRSIMQDCAALRTVLAATKGLSEINERGREWRTSPFLFGFSSVTIASLSDDDAVRLICQCDHPEGPVRVDSRLQEEIAWRCGNHPFLIQWLCFRLYQSDRSLRPLIDADFLIDEQLYALFSIDFAQLSTSEQVLLRALSRHAPQSELQLSRNTGVRGQKCRTFLHGLEQLGFIRRRSDGSFEPSSEFLIRWLKMIPRESATSHVSEDASLDVTDVDRQHWQELRAMHKRRLHVLEKRAAQEGRGVDPSIMIEIEDLYAEIQKLEERLGIG